MSTSSQEGKGRYGSFRIPIADERVGVQVKLWDLLRTRATPERFWDARFTKKRYKVYVPLTFTYTGKLMHIIMLLLLYCSVPDIRNDIQKSGSGAAELQAVPRLHKEDADRQNAGPRRSQLRRRMIEHVQQLKTASCSPAHSTDLPARGWVCGNPVSDSPPVPAGLRPCNTGENAAAGLEFKGAGNRRGARPHSKTDAFSLTSLDKW